MPRKRSRGRRTPRSGCARFNEAGALCPGKGPPPTLFREGADRCFNEAGALCPGKGIPPTVSAPPAPGFNEAGALCPGKGWWWPSAIRGRTELQ